MAGLLSIAPTTIMWPDDQTAKLTFKDVCLTDESLKNKYLCDNCHNLMVFPYQLSQCGHRICHECYVELFRNTSSLSNCPSGEDCGPISINTVFSDKSIWREIRKLIVKCKYWKKGCPEEMPLSECQKHLETCSFASDCNCNLQVIELKKTIKDMQHKHDKEKAELKSLITQLVDRMNEMETRFSKISPLSSEDGMVAEYSKKVKELEFRLHCCETASHNGVLMWRIGDFKKRFQEAKDKKIGSIYSQPFYTTRFGYKMCARAYLAGDGVGRGYYISVFFVLMKGEFDDFLPWPFKYKVSISLLDCKDSTKHWTQSFKPDEKSNSFRKPIESMNIASGFPTFIKHEDLENNTHRFVKDDIICFKIEVEVPERGS